jgi:hypothetical protein
MGSLTITYQAPGQRPLSVATVEDERLLRMAAQLALEQAEQRAAAVASEDPIMGMLQAAEVRRLRAALSILVPGFAVPNGAHDDMQ